MQLRLLSRDFDLEKRRHAKNADGDGSSALGSHTQPDGARLLPALRFDPLVTLTMPSEIATLSHEKRGPQMGAPSNADVARSVGGDSDERAEVQSHWRHKHRRHSTNDGGDKRIVNIEAALHGKK